VTNSPADSRLRDTATDDAWRMGLAAGFGIEYMLAPNWTLRGEYLYLDFPDVLVNLVPVAPVGVASDAISRRNFAYSAQLARVGLNYKFDGSPYPAPARPPVAASWTGAYIGVNGGGGIAQADVLDMLCFSCTDTTFHKGFGAFGGQAGYSWQWASTVLGLEGDLDWASASETRGMGLNPGNCCIGTAGFKFDAFGSIRARIGLAFDRTLAYVTAGPAWGHFGSAVNSFGLSPYTVADGGWRAGLATGAGVEFMLAPQWTVRAEYLNLAFHDDVVGCVPLNGGAAALATANNCRFTFANSAHLARVGLNYKFDWAGSR
jgi:outer membrane immunogenic protein